MCLSTLEKFKTNGKGWKVFYYQNTINERYYSSVFFPEYYEENKEYISKQHIIVTNDSHELYNSGFHIFKTKKDAINYKEFLKTNEIDIEDEVYKLVVRKVSYNDVFTTGVQNIQGKNLKIIVADKMEIL